MEGFDDQTRRETEDASSARIVQCGGREDYRILQTFNYGNKLVWME
jgi:hypothetical protein